MFGVSPNFRIPKMFSQKFIDVHAWSRIEKRRWKSIRFSFCSNPKRLLHLELKLQINILVRYVYKNCYACRTNAREFTKFPMYFQRTCQLLAIKSRDIMFFVIFSSRARHEYFAKYFFFPRRVTPGRDLWDELRTRHAGLITTWCLLTPTLYVTAIFYTPIHNDANR